MLISVTRSILRRVSFCGDQVQLALSNKGVLDCYLQVLNWAVQEWTPFGTCLLCVLTCSSCRFSSINFFFRFLRDSCKTSVFLFCAERRWQKVVIKMTRTRINPISAICPPKKRSLTWNVKGKWRYTWTQAIFGRITADLIVLAELLPSINTTYYFGGFGIGCLKSGITILLNTYVWFIWEWKSLAHTGLYSYHQV